MKRTHFAIMELSELKKYVTDTQKMLATAVTLKEKKQIAEEMDLNEAIWYLCRRQCAEHKFFVKQ